MLLWIFQKNMNECCHGISQKYEWMFSWNFPKIWMNVVMEFHKNMNECCLGIKWMNDDMEYSKIYEWMLLSKFLNCYGISKKIWMNAVMEFHKKYE